jgi:hypothetical protein
MEKYMVTSWDNNQQQCFFDVVLARDTDHANLFISGVRPYVVVVDVSTEEELRNLADSVQREDPTGTGFQCPQCWDEDRIAGVANDHDEQMCDECRAEYPNQ